MLALQLHWYITVALWYLKIIVIDCWYQYRHSKKMF